VYSRRNLIQPVFADYQICVRKLDNPHSRSKRGNLTREIRSPSGCSLHERRALCNPRFHRLRRFEPAIHQELPGWPLCQGTVLSGSAGKSPMHRWRLPACCLICCWRLRFSTWPLPAVSDTMQTAGPLPQTMLAKCRMAVNWTTKALVAAGVSTGFTGVTAGRLALSSAQCLQTVPAM
jgi:hypothetical protein